LLSSNDIIRASEKMGKGVTLSEEETAALRDLLADALEDEA
jgi:hypothetical protein